MFDKTETLTLHIEGMHCMHCVKSVTDALKSVKGVKSVRVNLEGAYAEVGFVPQKTDRAAMVAAVCALGFTAE